MIGIDAHTLRPGCSAEIPVAPAHSTAEIDSHAVNCVFPSGISSRARVSGGREGEQGVLSQIDAGYWRLIVHRVLSDREAVRRDLVARAAKDVGEHCAECASLEDGTCAASPLKLPGLRKGAVLALTRSLAVQFAPQGVRTNAILPGPVETPLLMDWLLKDEAAKNLRLARNPTGRFGKPDEVVALAVYLASDESAWTNGASLVIDGGISVNYF